MGCGCGSSRVTTPLSSTSRLITNNVSLKVENCEYTIDQFRAWLIKLVCCKDKGLYIELGINAQTMNKYLGIVMSAINYPSNPCYFENQLAPIGNFVIRIINTEKC